MAEADLDIAYGLFCEFVRSEATGKVTLIGVWPDQCRFLSAPPGLLPNIGLVIYVRNPRQQPLHGRLRVYWPGTAAPIEIPIDVPAPPSAGGTYLVFNFANPVFPTPGRLVARIDLAPLAPRDYAVEIAFEPPGAALPAGTTAV